MRCSPIWLRPRSRRCCANPGLSLEFAGGATQPSRMRYSLYCLAFAVVTFALAPSLAHAQSADLVLCDRVAADPSDPDKPADVRGVTDVAPADVATAIKFCKKAAGSSRRAMYELGRAYAANNQTADALGAWRKAADKRSPSA